MNFSDDEIREMFDQNPDLTLSQLERITGLTVSELKSILMS